MTTELQKCDNKKPRVVFPFTEAGLGHIVPLKELADEFERQYGDKVEVVRSQFFTESGEPKLKLFQDRLSSEVVHHNKRTSYGYFATINMEFWRIRLSSWAAMKFLALGSRKRAYRHMSELNADLVVSTHWATNYYARHIDPMPLTVVYCPDTDVNPLFSYSSDLVLAPTAPGVDLAKKKHPVRFNDDNIRHVPYIIRKEAFALQNADKRAMRKKLGLDENKFTVMLAEGGYGIGKMEEICNLILRRDLPVNLVPVCGKNEELYKEFLAKPKNNNTVFLPIGYTDSIFEYMVCSDVFCGKAGSILAELTFFGVPQIITKCATLIEEKMAKYYLQYVKSAVKIFDPKAVVDKIAECVDNRDVMNIYAENALKQRSNYGAKQSAQMIFDVLCTRFPELKND